MEMERKIVDYFYFSCICVNLVRDKIKVRSCHKKDVVNGKQDWFPSGFLEKIKVAVQFFFIKKEGSSDKINAKP